MAPSFLCKQLFQKLLFKSLKSKNEFGKNFLKTIIEVSLKKFLLCWRIYLKLSYSNPSLIFNWHNDDEKNFGFWKSSEVAEKNILLKKTCKRNRHLTFSLCSFLEDHFNLFIQNYKQEAEKIAQIIINNKLLKDFI